MSTTTTPAETTEQGQYEREESFGVITWTHDTTGLQVEASRVHRPTQMHDPMTATDEEFWRLIARHDGESVVITERVPVGDRGREQSGKETIVERAREWMTAHPDGEL